MLSWVNFNIEISTIINDTHFISSYILIRVLSVSYMIYDFHFRALKEVL